MLEMLANTSPCRVRGIGHPMVLSALRSYNPDVSIQDASGRNALMIALAANNPYKAMLLLEWQSLDLPLLLKQRDAEGLTVYNYCDRFFATRVQDRIRELTTDSFITRMIVFKYNHQIRPHKERVSRGQ